MRFRSGVVMVVSAGALVFAAPAFAAPPNDSFAAAQAISGNAASVAGTTAGATLEAGEPNHFVSGNGSVWYRWTAPQNMLLHLDTCAGSGGTKVQLWRGTAVNSLTEVQPRSDTPNCDGFSPGDRRVFNVAAGSTYAISVIEYADDSTFTLALAAALSPPNDNFAAAQDLGQQLNVDVDGTTVGATLEPGEPDYFGGVGDGESVWYRWTAPKRTRIWFDNCNAQSNSQVAVYTGTSVASLGQLEPSYFGDPLPPGCEGDGLYGARDEFLAHAGTTYMIRVQTDLYEAGAFHLRLREIRFDASLAQEASAKKVKKGKAVTYTVSVENLGTVPIDPDVDLVTSKPNKLAKPVVGTKYVSLETTNGTCKRVTYFAVHPGAICRLDLAPGERARIVAKVKPSQSLSHWAELDYAHGADSPIYDEDRGNEDEAPANTVVKKRKHKHRHHHHHHH